MAFQVSPGVNISEIDATTVIPAVSTGNAGIACAFQWGPVEEITTISSEDDLVTIFGKPDIDTATNWLSASNYLAYSGGLRVIRTIDTATHYNADDGTSLTGSITVESGGAAGWTQGNDIGGSAVGGEDGVAYLVGDTWVSSSKKGIGLKVDYTATDGVVQTVSADSVSVTATDAYTAATFYTTILDGNNDAVIELTVASDGDDIADFTIAVVHGGSGYNNLGGNAIPTLTLGDQEAGKDIGQLDLLTASTVATNIITEATLVMDPGHLLEVGDRIVWAIDVTAANDAVLKITSFTSAALVKNKSHFEQQTITTSSFVSRYPGAYGNNVSVGIVHQVTSSNFTDGHVNARFSGTGWTLDAKDVFDAKPETSDYVKARNGGVLIVDEIHIVVIDDTGIITGTAGTALERFANVSLCTDARNDSGNSNYFKDVVNSGSQYVWATGQWDGANNANKVSWEGKDSTYSTAFTSQTTAITSALTGGAGNNSTANSAGNRNGNDIGYGLFADPDTSDVSLLITGDADSTLVDGVIDRAIARKDAIAFYSPPSADVVSQDSASEKASNIIDFKNTDVNNASSYAVMDSGWKRVYDRYNDVFRDIPLNSDIAGLVARTEQTREAWWSPAGYERGALKNVVKLHFNPPQAQRDSLYKASINPVVSFPGQGVILFGDKTTLGKPSAFDRINVRRLFIVLEKAISRAAKFSLFEFNDGFTRSQFKTMVEPFLRTIKARRGIFDYKVICDSTNNTPEVIDRNEFVGDIYVKPARSINFIQLNFIAVRTGVSFNEVAGAI